MSTLTAREQCPICFTHVAVLIDASGEMCINCSNESCPSRKGGLKGDVVLRVPEQVKAVCSALYDTVEAREDAAREDAARESKKIAEAATLPSFNVGELTSEAMKRETGACFLECSHITEARNNDNAPNVDGYIEKIIAVPPTVPTKIAFIRGCRDCTHKHQGHPHETVVARMAYTLIDEDGLNQMIADGWRPSSSTPAF